MSGLSHTPGPRPTTPEELLAQIETSQILAPSHFNRLQATVLNRTWKSTRAFGKWLIERQVLTRWQTQQLLEGSNAFFVAGFKLLEKVDRDSQSVTFVAEDIRRQRLVRLIVTREQPIPPVISDWLSHVSHPRLIQFLRQGQCDKDGDVTFIATDYEDGPTCRHLLLNGKRFHVAEAATVVSQLFDLIQALQPPVVCEPISLDEFHVSEHGHVRWTGFRLPASNTSHTLHDAQPIPWNLQLIALFLKLMGTSLENQSLSRNLLSEELQDLSSDVPEDVLKALSQLLQSDEFPRGENPFHPFVTLLRWKPESVPGHLRRNVLNKFLRRSQEWRHLRPTTTCISDLLRVTEPQVELVPEASRTRDDQTIQSWPSLRTDGPPAYRRRKRPAFGAWTISASVLALSFLMALFAWFMRLTPHAEAPVSTETGTSAKQLAEDKPQLENDLQPE
ncbi:MAG: hypothetical protein KDA88_01125 [Planctomycetaceae bacterium]|nr:hypothetical protein [Planctomycetaceae bacterium]MCB9950771.1 hypothetical protein [Planctomycetaceae bacterium]